MKVTLSLLFLAFALVNASLVSTRDQQNRYADLLTEWLLDMVSAEDTGESTCDPKVNFLHPVKAKDYQCAIGPGFSTNYFKSEKPAAKYMTKNIQDVYDNGFRNLRLRARADLYCLYNDERFKTFLTKLEEVVDECIQVGVAPIISWIHHNAEAYATEKDRDNYIIWWTKVATALKDKSYLLSFNLFTELGVDECVEDGLPCDNSLRKSPTKYNQWTSEVVAAIRNTGGNNAKRILILGSPTKTGDGLWAIDESIYQGKEKDYMMVEWHIYAAGPHKVPGGPRYWSGDGSIVGRKNVQDALKAGVEFSKDTGIPSYFGAWMPQDNLTGKLKQSEVESFARFFVKELKRNAIPWSLNVLDVYYETKECRWRKEKQYISEQHLDMYKVLNIIRRVM